MPKCLLGTILEHDGDITSNEAKACKICRGTGDEGLKSLNASGLTDAQKKTTDKLWALIECQLKISVNLRIH